MTRLLLAVLLAFAAARNAAAAATSRSGRTCRARTEQLYQAGMGYYAQGRIPQALESFEASLRCDPSYRPARAAVNRVRSELEMTGAVDRAAWEGGPRPPPPAEDETILTQVERVVHFEDTVGDARERAGRLEALQGRIRQLLAERRVARARHRRFRKDAELRALSRRQA